MLEVALPNLLVAQMTSQKRIRACFDAVTVNAAKVTYLRGYGLEVVCDASFVLLQARDAVEVTLPLDSVSHNRDHELACLASHSLSNCIGLT